MVKKLKFVLSKKKCFLSFSFILIYSYSIAQVVDPNIFIYSNTPLETVLEEWENTFDYSFSYDADLIAQYQISQQFVHLSIEDKLTKLFREIPLDYKIFSDKTIIIKRRTTDIEKKQKTSICGQIIEADTRTPLPYVHVLLHQTNLGTITDDEGYFNLNEIFVPDDSLKISFIGYQTLTYSASQLKDKPCLRISLKVQNNKMTTVIVSDKPISVEENTLFKQDDQSAATTFKLQQMDDIGGLAEQDVLQSLQLLPGISSAEESASRLHIRGANEGQNLVLFDDIPLYHFGHFFGKTASINPNIIEEVSVSKEGYNAKYGGRIAGVIDMKSKQKIPDSISLKLESSLLSGNINAALPIVKNKVGVLLSYRRSFTDFYASTIFNNFFEQTFQHSRITTDQEIILSSGRDSVFNTEFQATFSDFNTKLLFTPNAKNKFSISALSTTDFMSYQYNEKGGYDYHERDSLHISNGGINAQWTHHWTDHFTTNSSYSVSKYENQYSFQTHLVVDSASTYHTNANKIHDQSFRLMNSWVFTDQQLDFGYHFSEISEFAHVFKRDAWQEDTLFADDITAISHALFLNYKIKASKKINCNIGSRLTHYNLTDKIYFEPRFSIKINPFKHFSVILSSGIYYQAINQAVETNQLNAEDHLWYLARGDNQAGQPFSMIKNNQYSYGFSYQNKGWIIDLATYGKKYEGITSLSLRIDNNEFPAYSGNMEASGLECSVQKKSKWFYTFLSYTYSKVNYIFDYLDYPLAASYNRQHSLSALLGFQYNNLTLSAILKMSSGRPYTPFDSLYVDRSEDPNDPEKWGYAIEYQNYNQERLLPYQRIDLSLSWKFKTRHISGKLTLAALNVTNHINELQRYYSLQYPANDADPPEVKRTDTYGLGFTPNVGFMLLF